MYQKSLFKHYYDWTHENKRSNAFNLTFFQEWIKEENEDKLLETIETINDKFYKKTKWFIKEISSSFINSFFPFSLSSLK